jgi:ABC-2 type transport system permease protein
LAFLESDTLIKHSPDAASFIWLPARAMLGDHTALAVLCASSLLFLAATAAVFSPKFGDHAVAAAGISQAATQQIRLGGFRNASPRRALRHKEWALLRRDPWLVSQTLMQILYLLPPALMLWRSYGDGIGIAVVLVPVLVMSAGQLAGGLAWLAISGEDAPELVATAPIPTRWIVRAKIEGVLSAVAVVFIPFVVALAFISPYQAFVSAAGIAIAVIAATFIQLCFRSQAKRAQFRRRHISSRIATFAEAFSSISWAGTAALAAGESFIALLPATIGVCILIVARMISPRVD